MVDEKEDAILTRAKELSKYASDLRYAVQSLAGIVPEDSGGTVDKRPEICNAIDAIADTLWRLLRLRL